MDELRGSEIVDPRRVEVDTATSLGLAAFYELGHDGPIPTYAEEQLAHIQSQNVVAPPPLEQENG